MIYMFAVAEDTRDALSIAIWKSKFSGATLNEVG
jgi:hypothetical protein